MTACTIAATCVLVLAGPSQIIGSGPAYVEMTATARGYSVAYHNRIVKSLTLERWTVEVDGLTVAGVIASQNGDLPDDLIVTPPLGWWCHPSCVVTVQENDVGTVELWPEIGA